MEKIRLSRAIVISGAVAFVAFLVLAGLLVYEYISVPKGGTEPVSIVSVPASWTLSDEQIGEALQIGKDLKVTEDGLFKFIKDNYTQYTEGTIAPQSEVLIMTPYSYILNKASWAQKNYEDYSFADAQKDAQEKVLSFAVTVYGASIDFCSDFKAVLILSDGSAIHPRYQDVPSLADQSVNWPDYPAYKATCYWLFDASQIGRNDTVTFVLIRAGGEQRTVIDLSKYK